MHGHGLPGPRVSRVQRHVADREHHVGQAEHAEGAEGAIVRFVVLVHFAPIVGKDEDALRAVHVDG